MKVVVIIARILLGLVFLIFGMNAFLHFIPAPPMPPGPLHDFSEALQTTHYIYAVAFCQVFPAVLLLINRYVPFALTILGPVIVNILLTHILMAPNGLPIAIFVAILWFLIFWRVRSAFAGIFQSRVAD